MARLIPELSVQDWPRSRAFYCDIIGFSPLYERPAEGFSMLALGQAKLMIDQQNLGRSFDPGLSRSDHPWGRGLNLELSLEALDPVLARIQSAQLPLHLPLETQPYEIKGQLMAQRQCVIADPDGYLLRLAEARPHPPQAPAVSARTAPHYKWQDVCDGWRLLDRPDLSVTEEQMPPGSREIRHCHARARQLFYLFSGALEIELDGEPHPLAPGEALEIPPGQAHEVRAPGREPARFLVISAPSSKGDRSPA